jgi:hypothetical protein
MGSVLNVESSGVGASVHCGGLSRMTFSECVQNAQAGRFNQ